MATLDRAVQPARTQRVERLGEAARLELRPDLDRLTIVPDGSGRPLSPSFIRWCISHVRSDASLTVQTAAITHAEAAGFLADGFTVTSELRLLVHDLARPLRAPEHVARRLRWTDHEQALEIDAAAFPSGSGLDPLALRGALAATPQVRWRGVFSGDSLLGFAITGRAGRRGYLQRLAVDPGAQGQGVGRSLVEDALRWCGRWGVRRTVVNTQHDNLRALCLYRACGFRDAPVGLCVLERTAARVGSAR